jgi:heme exporter protein D
MNSIEEQQIEATLTPADVLWMEQIKASARWVREMENDARREARMRIVKEEAK